jgi:transposase
MNLRNNNDTNMTRLMKAQVKAKALEDYRRGDPLKAIAIRYGVSVATVSLWAKAAGLERRRQGCRFKLRPEERDMEIVNAVRAVVDGKPTMAEIGRRWGWHLYMSRSNVHRIYHKWKDWKPTVPFESGDIIRFKHRDYEVVEPGVFEGKVRSLRTGRESTIPWKEGEHIAVKLGAGDKADAACGCTVGAATGPVAAEISTTVSVAGASQVEAAQNLTL